MAAPVRRYIDPSTKDWRFVRGVRQGDPTMTSNVVFELSLKYGSSPVMPTSGSKLHLIRKATDDSALQAKREIERCLKKFIDDRRISTLSVTTKVVSSGGSGAYLSAEVNFIDASGQRNNVKFGVKPGA